MYFRLRKLQSYWLIYFYTLCINVRKGRKKERTSTIDLKEESPYIDQSQTNGLKEHETMRKNQSVKFIIKYEQFQNWAHCRMLQYGYMTIGACNVRP